MPGSKAAKATKGASAEGIAVLKGMLDMLPVRSAVLDRDGRVAFANGSLRADLGSKEGQLIFDHLSPTSIQEVLDALRGIKPGSSSSIDTALIGGEGGDLVTLHLIGVRSLGKEEVLCILMPRTPPHGVPDLSALVRSLDVPAQVVNADLSVASVNDRFREEMSWIGGKKGPYKEQNAMRREFLAGCIRSGRGGEMELSIDERGRPTRYLSIASPLEGAGHVGALLEIWIDITRSSRPDKAGAGEGELYDEMLDTSNAVVIGLDKEGKVQLYNKGAQRALGYSREAVMGTSWFDYMADPGTGKGALDVFQWNINTGFRTRFENRVRSASGDPVTISWENTVIFDGRGGVKTILMIGQDITQMKRLEERLVQRTQELARALEEAGIYNDLMLHDIHNSTAAIMGYLELMDLKGLPAEKRQEYGARALSEVKKSASIVKEVRALSRVDAASGAQTIRLGAALSKTADRIGKLAGSRTAVHMEVKDIAVHADENIEEALVRIVQYILNRMEAPPAKVMVHARRAPSLSTQVPQPVLISVTAPGLSIDKEEAESLFRSVPRKGGLSDRLGMYLVRRVVERYGGSFWVDEDGSLGGSRFNIVLRESI